MASISSPRVKCFFQPAAEIFTANSVPQNTPKVNEKKYIIFNILRLGKTTLLYFINLQRKI